jgi:pyrroline-5-carboxylate reductase
MSKQEEKKDKVAIVGAGNIGIALGIGFCKAKEEVLWIRRKKQPLEGVLESFGGEYISSIEHDKLYEAKYWLLCVPRSSVCSVVETLAQNSLSRKADMSSTWIVSVATGVELSAIEKSWESFNSSSKPKFMRAMPNIAASIQQSMTCVSSKSRKTEEDCKPVLDLFQKIGKSKLIEEEFMDACTVLCGSGVAFFLRMVRAACQGGVQIGFSSHDALELCAQTAIGAMELLSADVPGNPLFDAHVNKKASQSMIHPEVLIDQVTTPRGCTIEGLNTMEQEGLHSAIIKGIVASERKIKSMKKDV